MQVLQKLHFDGTNDEWIQREFFEIKTTLQAEKEITVPGWRIMFTVPQWRTRLMHGVAVQAFTQLTGISMSTLKSIAAVLTSADVIGYYQTIMYDALGITGNQNLLVTGIYNVIGPITSKFQDAADRLIQIKLTQ